MNNPLLALLQDEDTGEVTFDLATVYSSDSGGIRLTLKNQSDPTQKKYKKLSSYAAPQVGDRVVIMKVSGSYLVLGAIGNAESDPLSFPLSISKGGTGQTGVSGTQAVSEIATAAEGWNITSANYWKWGKLAMLALQIYTTQEVTITTETPIATIAQDKRPVVVSSAQVWLATAYVALVHYNGNVLMNKSSSGAIAADTGFTILATYLLP